MSDGPAARAATSSFEERTVVMALCDLAGFTHAVSGQSALEIAAVLDRFHRLAGRRVAEHGGRVVKFSGDSCLAIFEPADAMGAVRCVTAIGDDVVALGIGVELGANVHLATVAVGMFGEPATASFDVVGQGVIHTYRLGSGAGIRITEPVYRKLPSAERSPWRRFQPPAIYRFEP